jgi:hypothetical protein
MIRNLENINVMLEDGLAGNLNAKADQLISKKQEIEHLMELKSLREGLKEDYQYAKKKIIAKLQENV